MSLEPLEHDERIQVIESGLKLIREKPETEYSIDETAAALISELSEGYPHFLQQFAYSAVEEDQDHRISVDDARTGAFKEHGALDQLGNKYFYDMYHSINSDDYRSVLLSMSDQLDGWISRAEIIEKSKLKSTTVDNALQSLKKKSIILQGDSKRGDLPLTNEIICGLDKSNGRE